MRVLLTGGAGYIGSHTALALLEAGHEAVALDNLSNSSPEALKRVGELTGKKVPLAVGDCTDHAFTERVFQKYGPFDAVIHFAGLKAVGESVEKPLMYYKNNLDATFVLLDVMKKHGCKSIVFSSSATVYGTNSQMPLKEDYPTGCTSPYGWTKYMNEQVLRDVAVSDGLHVVLLRYFNPVGAHPSGRIGEDPSGIPNNLMPFICQVASGKLKQLRVFGSDYDTPDGTGVRDYLHVCDLADGHVKALEYAEDHPGVEVINLGTGKGHSVFELIRAFEEVNHLRIPCIIVERRPGDVAECYADASKARELLGWEAKRTLRDMCADAWRWQKQNPRGYDERR